MKKLLAMALALMLILSAAAAAAELKTIEEGKFIYATSPDFPPFEFRDDNDNIVGIEPELIALIAEKIGLTAEPLPMDFDGALLAARVDMGAKADMIVSGVTVTEERKLIYDFTDPYTTITQAIVSKDGAVTKDQLPTAIIGVQSGTTGQIAAVDDFGEDHVAAYDKYSLAFQALQNGQVDCIMVDDMVGAAYVKQIPGLEMIQTNYEPEEFAFGFAKGNTGLVDAFNAELQKLIDDGTVEQIILKWNE
jgi:polar amino acid transport system substrate-binding protein